MNELESILISIKKLLGIEKDDTSFDTDVILHVNSILSVLCQVGIGPEKGFWITGEQETWKDFLGENLTKQSMVVSYVYLRVKLLFDHPTSSFVTEAMKENLKELEWRLNISVD